MKTTCFVATLRLFIFGVFLCENGFATTVADFRTDIIGQTNNPHADSSGLGTWNYYRSNTVNPSDAGANLTAYVWDAANSQFKDPSAAYGQVRQTNVHPAYGNFVTVRWQAATNDTYLVTGFFQRNPTVANGDGVSVFVYVDGELQTSISTNLPAATGNPKIEFNFITDVNVGQFVDFVVDAGDTIEYDRTDFDVSINNLNPDIVNWSFQDPDYELGGAEGGTTIPGWQKEAAAWASPGIQVDGKSGSPPAPDGDQWCFFNLVPSQSGTGGNAGSIWQNVGYVQEKYDYTAEFTLGNRSVSIDYTVKVSLWRGGSSPSVSGGSTLIGEISVDPPPVSSTTTQDYQITFTTGSGFGYEVLWLRFDVSVPGGASEATYQMLLDAVKLTATPDLSYQATLIMIQ